MFVDTNKSVYKHLFFIIILKINTFP